MADVRGTQIDGGHKIAGRSESVCAILHTPIFDGEMVNSAANSSSESPAMTRGGSAQSAHAVNQRPWSRESQDSTSV